MLSAFVDPNALHKRGGGCAPRFRPRPTRWLSGLATGARTLWVRFSPVEKAGIRGKDILFTPDGSRFAYVVRRINSNLFVADGLR
jgi:hypothetical protein